MSLITFQKLLPLLSLFPRPSSLPECSQSNDIIQIPPQLGKSLQSASFKPFTPEFSTGAAETFQHALGAFLYPTDTLTVLTMCHQACKPSLCPQGTDTTEGHIQAGNCSTFRF